jgi:prepilin-type processing-associated H-X9-DG protein
MIHEQQSAGDSDNPATYSLRTLFLVVTCFAIACAAFRIAGGADTGIIVAFMFVSGFLTVWYFATGRRLAAGRLLLLTVTTLLIGILLLPRVSSGPASPREQCSNNLKQIGLAIEAYRQKYGSLPPAFVADAHGKPLYSWRVLISPELDQQALYDAFHLGEPWNSPHNSKISQAHWAVWLCPSDNVVLSHTSYLAVVGPNTAWPGAKTRKLADFADPSKMILVVEVANSGINWAEPRDLYVGQMAAGVNPKSGQGVSSGHSGGAEALFADGHIEFIPDDIDPKKLAEMFEICPPASSAK